MKDKQVLLTGGTGGLGLGVTPVVLAQGAKITIPYRNVRELERLKALLPPDDVTQISFVSTDLQDEQNVVLPSIIDTPANREAMGADNAHKWVKPKSLAQVICFLASEAAQDVRGAAVPLYGNT